MLLFIWDTKLEIRAVSALMLCIVSAILLSCYHAWTIKSRAKTSAPRLPGPKGLPLIGSIHELPSKCSWMKFHEWSKQYGPLYQCNLAGTNHVWISSDQIARELLGKRRAIYSDRPHIPALEQDNRTSGQYLPLMSINDKWSRQRNFGRYVMTKSHEQSYNAYPELEAIRLLDALMRDPTKYADHLESYVARVTSRLAWGSPTPAEGLKQRARELLIGVSPDGALGNKIPFIMKLPTVLSSAKAWEARRSKAEQRFLETLQQNIKFLAKVSMASSVLLASTDRVSFASRLK